MIVTKAWLNEWIELDGNTTDDICKSLNAIGLEVDAVNKLSIPEGVKVGFVKACEKHPDADKLNVCQVDLGDEEVQIVCGAKNVAQGQHVAVATIGTVLGDDFKIKKAKLRGVESSGMICSATEIGLPDINDGILELDESIGVLTLGKQLTEYTLLNDDIIEIELTANRGDCLSVYGVSRDLSASLGLEKKNPNSHFVEDPKGIANIFQFEIEGDIESGIEQKFFEVQKIVLPLLYQFRLACIDHKSTHILHDYLTYATQATGVLFRAYDFDKLVKSDDTVVSLRKDSEGFDTLYRDQDPVSIIGINQVDDFVFTSGKYAVVEASYVDPDIISQKKSVSEVVSDDLFYHSSRGSEPELSFGMAYLCALTSENSDLAIYAGSHKHQLLFDPRVIKVEHQFINSFIGQDISSQKIITILTHLGFDVRAEEDAFMITIPAFRHDVCHAQDVIEELVRITGIDNIASKALTFKESHQINETYVRYKKRTHFRHKAASIGFFESVHYFFDNKALMDKYELPILNEALDVTNPITNELTTLRSTLLLHLINSASRNAKFGKKSIRLFEIGRVVNTSRGEQSKIAFIFSGEREAPSVDNHGKPALINFFEFAKMVSSVVGKFTLEESDVYNPLVSPYEYANVIIEGKRVGFIARTHIKLEQEFDLSNSYVCELDFDLLKYDKIIAKAYSKFPALSRDLSLLVPKEIKFSAIRNFLAKALPQEVISFAPIDIYESEDLGDLHSVTVKFHLQSETQTLQDEQITAIMDTILVQLKEKFGIGMR